MQATIKINESELDYKFFKKLKSLFRNRTFTIDVEELSDKYLSELSEAIDDVEAERNLVAFTGDEYLKMIEDVAKK